MFILLHEGDLYDSLAALFRVSRISISVIVPTVCWEIYLELKDDFLKVNETLYFSI